MTRPIGITVAAVLVIVGGGHNLLMGILVLALIFPLSDKAPEVAAVGMSTITLGLVTFVGSGTWGIATGVGLLRLRRWAQISTLIFSAILVFTGAVIALAVLFLPIPPSKGTSEQGMGGVRIAAALFHLSLVAVGLWWLYLFSRARVNRLFLGEVPDSERSRRPLSITIVGWYLVIAGISSSVFALRHEPTTLFGWSLTGWGAAFFYLLYAAAELYLGIGLLKLKPLSRTLAVYFFLFSFLTAASFVLLPGRDARFAVAINSLQPKMRLVAGSMSAFLSWFMVLFAAGELLPVWFLVAKKKAYLAAKKSSPASA